MDNPSSPSDLRWVASPWRTPQAMTLGVAGLLVGASFASMRWWDNHVSTWLGSLDLPGDVMKGLLLAEIFAHGTGVIAILMTLWWIDRSERLPLTQAAAMTLLSSAVANGLKYVFTRVRPHSSQTLDSATSWLPFFHGSFWDASQRSFPSGHAATAVGLAIGLSLVYPRGKWFFACFAVLACFQRILVQAHYPSDVLMGAAIAVVCCHLCPRFPAKSSGFTQTPPCERPI